MTRTAAAPIWDILEEHLDEASFLWTQWELALASARHTIAEVAAGPEERLEAHLSALAAGGPQAEEELLVPALGSGGARTSAAAAVLASRARLEPLEAAIQPDSAPAITRALGLALPARAEPELGGWLRKDSPVLQAMALEVLSFRGAAPAAEVRRLLSTSDRALLAVALRASPVLGEAARPALESAVTAAELSVREAAIEAGLRLGLRAAWIACQRAADQGTATPLVLESLAWSGENEDVERVLAAAQKPESRRAALFAAGFTGSPAAVDLCARYLDDLELGRVAGEALSAIAGLAITGAYECTPEELEQSQRGNENGIPPALGAELGLPFPDADLVGNWWDLERPRFAPGQRWLAGKPWTPEGVLQAFTSGPTRRRHALGRELGARSRGEWRVETRAFARDQLREQKPLVLRGELALPFGRLLR